VSSSQLETDYVVHCYARSEGVAGVVITKDYPNLAAHSVLSKLMDQFLSEKPVATIKGANKDNEVVWAPLKEYLTNFQDANNASSIAKIQQELDETKIILHKAIDSVRPSPSPCFHRRILTTNRSCNAARSSTTWWPRVPTSAHKARCSTRAQRSRTLAALSCKGPNLQHVNFLTKSALHITSQCCRSITEGPAAAGIAG